MPSPMSLTMPSSSPALSSHHQHVLDLAITPLSTLVHAIDRGDAGNNQNTMCPKTPRRARTHTDTSLDAPEHHFAPLRQPSLRSLLSHAHSARHQQPPRQPHLPARALSPTPSSTSAATVPRGRRRRPHALVHHFQRHDARRARHDLRNSHASLRCPFAAQNIVAIDDLTMSCRSTSPAIKGGHPCSFPSHQSYTLSLLSLPDSFPSPITP
jgi:hypothetical protein